jgi:hypothetical protein
MYLRPPGATESKDIGASWKRRTERVPGIEVSDMPQEGFPRYHVQLCRRMYANFFEIPFDMEMNNER